MTYINTSREKAALAAMKRGWRFRLQNIQQQQEQSEQIDKIDVCLSDLDKDSSGLGTYYFSFMLLCILLNAQMVKGGPVAAKIFALITLACSTLIALRQFNLLSEITGKIFKADEEYITAKQKEKFLEGVTATLKSAYFAAQEDQTTLLKAYVLGMANLSMFDESKYTNQFAEFLDFYVDTINHDKWISLFRGYRGEPNSEREMDSFNHSPSRLTARAA